MNVQEANHQLDIGIYIQYLDSDDDVITFKHHSAELKAKVASYHLILYWFSVK